MNYVSGYEHDVFVSYAHVDDTPLGEAKKKGWVTNLIALLETRLAQRLGRSDAFSIWMDRELAGNVRITREIAKTLDATATLLVVLSPGYVASDWCKREYETFCKVLSRKRQDSDSRIFVVEFDKLDSPRPEVLDDLKGYSFWIEDDAKSSKTLGLTKDTEDEELAYWRQFDALARDVERELKRLVTTSGSSAGADRHAAEPRPVVFLAEVTDDLDPPRESVRAYLDQYAVDVLPAALYPRDPADYETRLRADLEKSKAFVQLLSSAAGKKPPELPQGRLRLQFDVAQELGKPILQWRDRDLDLTQVADADHRQLLEGPSVLAMGLEEFKATVKEKALQKDKPPEEATRDTSAGAGGQINAFVFINTERDDRELADEVCAFLKKEEIAYALPLEEGRPTEKREDLEDNLRDCDALIVIYGNATVRWVREQLRQAHKIIAARRRSLYALALFEGPPLPKKPPEIELPHLQVIDCRGGFDETAMRNFIDKLRNGEEEE